MSQEKNQELFTRHQVNMWMMDCAALQADTLTNKNVIGGIRFRQKLAATSVYSGIRILMEVCTKIPKGHRSNHRS